MLGIFSSAFMIATRMDGFALAGTPVAAPHPATVATSRRARAGWMVAALRRLIG